MSNQEVNKDEKHSNDIIIELEAELDSITNGPADTVIEGSEEEEVIDSAEAQKKEERYLSNLEDLKLVQRAKDQDQFAFEDLYVKYQYLINYKSKKYFAPGLDKDDLVQEGGIGLINAIRDFKMDHPTPFRVFCELCIERQIITAIKTATRQKHQPLNQYISFDKPVYEEDNDRSMHDTMENVKQFTPEDLIIDKENIYALLAKLKDRLSPLESEVFERQLQRLSYQEIANQLGRHVKSIDNAMQRIREKVIKARSEINDEMEG